jgi:hypothetical protein
VSGGLFPRREPTGVWWRDHSLSIVLGVLLAAQTVYCLWAGRLVYEAEQLDVPFWIWWSFEYQMSLVADTFGVALIVVLSKWLREEGSAESN